MSAYEKHEHLLGTLDLAGLPKEQQDAAQLFARSVAWGILGSVHDVSQGQTSLNRLGPAYSRAFVAWSQMSVLPPAALFGVSGSMLAWLWDVIRRLFDDRDIDMTGGTHNTDNGTVLTLQLEFNWRPDSDESHDDFFDLSPDAEPGPDLELDDGFELKPPTEWEFDLDSVGAGSAHSPLHWSSDDNGPTITASLGVGLHIDGITEPFNTTWPPPGLPSIPPIHVGPGDVALTGKIELKFP